MSLLMIRSIFLKTYNNKKRKVKSKRACPFETDCLVSEFLVVPVTAGGLGKFDGVVVLGGVEGEVEALIGKQFEIVLMLNPAFLINRKAAGASATEALYKSCSRDTKPVLNPPACATHWVKLPRTQELLKLYEGVFNFQSKVSRFQMRLVSPIFLKTFRTRSSISPKGGRAMVGRIPMTCCTA